MILYSTRKYNNTVYKYIFIYQHDTADKGLVWMNETIIVQHVAIPSMTYDECKTQIEVEFSCPKYLLDFSEVYFCKFHPSFDYWKDVEMIITCFNIEQHIGTTVVLYRLLRNIHGSTFHF